MDFLIVDSRFVFLPDGLKRGLKLQIPTLLLSPENFTYWRTASGLELRSSKTFDEIPVLHVSSPIGTCFSFLSPASLYFRDEGMKKNEGMKYIKVWGKPQCSLIPHRHEGSFGSYV